MENKTQKPSYKNGTGYVPNPFRAANSNEEEYATHARLEALKHGEELALFFENSEYYQAYKDAMQYGESMLNYSRQMGGISLQSGSTRGDSNTLISGIGNYHDQHEHQKFMIYKLDEGIGADEYTLQAVREIRTGNYRALDERFHFSERYNKHVTEPEGGKSKRSSAMIQGFCGTEEEIEKLKSAVDEHGISIFTEEEQEALEACVKANGFNTAGGEQTGRMFRDAAARAKHRMASGMLDETQRAGMDAVYGGVKAGKTAYVTGRKAAYAIKETKANRTVKKVDRLVSKRSELLTGSKSRRLKKLDRRLVKYQKKFGNAKDTDALRQAVRESQSHMREQRRARKELDRATSGLTRAEKRLFMNRVRQQEMLLKRGSVSARLSKKGTRLEKSIGRKKRLLVIRNKVQRRASKTLVGQAVGKGMVFANGAKRALSKLGTWALKYLLAPLGIFVLGAFLAILIVVLIIVLFSLFIEENTDTGKSDLQIVNEAMNEYEANELSALTSAIEAQVPLQYDNGLWEYGGYVEVEADYNVVDEYGNPGSICNCMQSMTLYRYYYLFADGSDSDELSESFWTGNFIRKMKQVWNETHFITTKGIFGSTHTKKWDRVNISMDDLTVTGALSGGSVFHSTTDGCTNICIYYTTESYIDDDGELQSDKVKHEQCAGHVRAVANVQVDTDVKNIAKGSRLEGKFGVNIEYDEFTDEEMQTIADYIGTYDTHYAEGYERYADFGIYFGASEGLMTSAEISAILSKLEEQYGELSELQVAVITTALQGCGKFTYSPLGHGNNGTGVTGGTTDCSGYTSWVHNNCGMYSDTVSLTTVNWASYGKEYKDGIGKSVLETLPPGSQIVKGDKSTGAAYGSGGVSTGTGNHTVIWIGYIDGQPMIVDCTTSNINGSSYRMRDVSNFKTVLRIGETAVW